jgi:hypothetical protein
VISFGCFGFMLIAIYHSLAKAHFVVRMFVIGPSPGYPVSAKFTLTSVFFKVALFAQTHEKSGHLRVHVYYWVVTFFIYLPEIFSCFCGGETQST